MEEHGLQTDPGLIEQHDGVRVGRPRGAQSVVTGSFIVTGEQLRLAARVADVETGRIIESIGSRGELDDFRVLLAEIIVPLVAPLGIELTEPSIETRSLDALLAFSDGVELEARGGYAAAHERFMTALEYDPDYERAGTRAANLEQHRRHD